VNRSLFFLSVVLQVSAGMLALWSAWQARRRSAWLLVLAVLVLQGAQEAAAGAWGGRLFLGLSTVVFGMALGLAIRKPTPQASWTSEAKSDPALRPARPGLWTEGDGDRIKRFQDAFDNAPLPIAIHAEDGEILAVNGAWTQGSGYAQEDIPTMQAWTGKAYPGWEEAVNAHNRTLYGATRQVIEGEFPIRTRTGETRIWVFTSTPLGPTPDGRRSVITIARDVTEQHVAQAGLAASEEKYRRFFDAMQEGFVLYEIILGQEGRPTDYRFLEVNPAFEALTGLPREKWIGRTLRELALHPEFEWMTTFDSVVLTQEPMRIEKYSEVRRRWFRVSACPLGPNQVAVLAEDITERKAVEASLRESLQRNRALLEANPDMMFVFSAEGRIMDAKLEPANETYVPRDAFMGKHLGEVLPSGVAELALENLAKVRLTGRADRFSYDLEMRGELKHYEARLVPCGKDTFLGVVRDVTEGERAKEERRRLRLQLEQAQKLESLGCLAGGVAHDMNNVLGAILAISSFNLEMHPKDSPTYRYFDTISKAATRGGEMVKSLLNLARQNPVEKREVDLNAILAEGGRLLGCTTLSRIRLEMSLAPGLRPVRGDANAFSHAFMNLCVNAVDAMPGQGVLSIRTRSVDDAWIEVQVEDTGCGMSREVLERAMDPFFTTKEQGKGTGLGLSMAYGTVKAHQGRMEIRSEPGKGTCVTVRLPACEPSGRPVQPPTAPPAGSSCRTLDVLLVDDDELVQDSMRELLKVKGHRPTSARCGEEALAQLEAGFRPDVVILDLNMPGMGGQATLPRLRRICPGVPILLATGRPDPAAQALAAAHPGVVLLPKPFDLQELQRHFEPITCS